MVHDLLHVRTGNSWELHVSSYPKLRVASAWLLDQCRAAGLEIRYDGTGTAGMQVLHLVKP
ncbi:hypothetical protein [Streptomyces oceani]|uniref:hypothetical protein n=1 Tax=Streptomyces oceani TaxID=1075402 RepID=UPI0008725ADA|nr:hypothetical protein [Streptomyces oceani]